MCQLHISLIRAAQIYLELHFCVELHTKKALLRTKRRKDFQRLTITPNPNPGAQHNPT